MFQFCLVLSNQQSKDFKELTTKQRSQLLFMIISIHRLSHLLKVDFEPCAFTALEDVSGLRFCTDFTEIRLSRKTRPEILTEVAKIKPKIVISMECVSPHDYVTY